MGKLDGKVAFISGGARGQGAAEAKLFVQEGARVVIGDILDEEGRKIEAEIQELGGEATYVHLDVTNESNWEKAIHETVDRLNRAGGKVAGVASPYQTNETNFMLGQLVNGIIGNLSQTDDEEINYPSGFRISSDRSPNKRGMKDVCPEILEDLISEIDKQNIRTIYILDNGVDRDFDAVWKSILSKMDFVVVQTYRMTMLAQSANIILPGLAPFEREGTITNDGGRVQWLRPSLPIKGESRADWEILMMVMKTMDKEAQVFTDVSQVMKKMGEKIPAYKDVSFFNLGDKGLSLNGIASK